MIGEDIVVLEYNPDPEDGTYGAWYDHIAQLEKETGRCTIFIPKRSDYDGKKHDLHDSDDDEEEGTMQKKDQVTKETFFCLWLPIEYIDIRHCIRNHILYGKGESHQVQKILEDNTKTSGNCTYGIIYREVTLAIMDGNVRRRFTKIFCIIEAMTENLSWLHFNRIASFKLRDLFRKLAKHVRSALMLSKKWTDKDFGIDYPTGFDADPNVTARDALYAYFDDCKAKVERYGKEHFITFDCNPGKPIKRKIGDATVDLPASSSADQHKYR